MARYFERFIADGPLVEISAEQATALGTYVEEIVGPPVHYKRFVHATLRTIIYPETPEPQAAVAHFHAHYQGLGASLDVVYDVVRSERAHAFTISYYDSSGEWKNSLRYEMDEDGEDYREFRLDAHGRVLDSISHVHDDTGLLLKRLHHDAAGQLVRTEWVDP